MDRISTKLNEIRPKKVVEFKLRVFDRFLMNFGHFGGNQNYCVQHYRHVQFPLCNSSIFILSIIVYKPVKTPYSMKYLTTSKCYSWNKFSAAILKIYTLLEKRMWCRNQKASSNANILQVRGGFSFNFINFSINIWMFRRNISEHPCYQYFSDNNIICCD
jgi:hypothetical protein